MENVIRLPLEHAYNVRELGGYTINNKESVKWHRFLRGDDLSALSEQDILYLKEYGVVFDLDLRSFSECCENPDRLLQVPGIQYVNIPFMTSKIDDVTKLEKVAENFNLSDFYISLLKDKHIVYKVMKAIAEAPKGCILFHCTAGKDRTGILSMLLLGLAGVCKEDILTNYQMSYINLQKKIKMLNKGIPSVFDVSCIYSNPETIETCIDYIENEYGTVEAYLSDCGLSIHQINNIKDRLLK